MRITKKLIIFSLMVFLTTNVFGVGAKDCDLSSLADQFKARLAEQTATKEAAREDRIAQMTEGILGNIAESDSAGKLQTAIEGLREKFAIKPDSHTSEVLNDSVRSLQENGENTKAMFEEVLKLNREVGNIFKDNVLIKLTKGIPFVGQPMASMMEWIGGRFKSELSRNRSGKEALAELVKVVDQRIADNRSAIDRVQKDELNWRDEYQALWDQAEVLKRVRGAIKNSGKSMDGLTDLQKRAFDLFHEEIADAEEIHRDLATKLQEQVQANLVIQKNYTEGTKTLQTKTKSHIRELSAALSNMASAEDAAKGYELAQKIKQTTSETTARVSAKVKQLGAEMIASKTSIANKDAWEKARQNRKDAKRAWNVYDAEAAKFRDERIQLAEQRYKEGEQELQENDIQRDVSNAVLSDTALGQKTTVVTKAEEETTEPKPLFDEMP